MNKLTVAVWITVIGCDPPHNGAACQGQGSPGSEQAPSRCLMQHPFADGLAHACNHMSPSTGVGTSSQPPRSRSEMPHAKAIRRPASRGEV
jgi:hypothetical protein